MAIITNLDYYWKLDGNSNATVGGAGNNGSDTSITYNAANGKIVQGAGFNGTTSGIAIGTAGGNTIGSGDFSVAFWVNITALPASGKQGALFSKRDDTGSNGLFYVAISDSGILKFIGRISGSGTQYTIDSASTLSTSTWYYVTVTRSGSNGYMYINASLDASNTSTFSSGNFNQSSYQLTFGMQNSGFGNEQFFSGKMDEVGYWSRALGSDEILSLYNNGMGLAYDFSVMSAGNMFAFF